MTVRIKYQPGFDIYLDNFLEISPLPLLCSKLNIS